MPLNINTTSVTRNNCWPSWWNSKVFDFRPESRGLQARLCRCWKDYNSFLYVLMTNITVARFLVLNTRIAVARALVFNIIVLIWILVVDQNNRHDSLEYWYIGLINKWWQVVWHLTYFAVDQIVRVNMTVFMDTGAFQIWIQIKVYFKGFV